MIRQAVCRYASVFCILLFVVVSAYQTIEKRKLAVFFDLPGKLNVGVLFVTVTRLPKIQTEAEFSELMSEHFAVWGDA